MPSAPEHYTSPLLHIVSAKEAGTKLFTFIERRLTSALPSSTIHKWIRSGQVRVNKKRAAPFLILQEQDAVRIPPFAQIRTIVDHSHKPIFLGKDLPIIAHEENVLLVNKPSGLAVQPGTGLQDSVTHRLQKSFAQQPFIPAAAHRLDKPTSGLLAVGTSHTALAALHKAFADKTLDKYYLTWVTGNCEFEQTRLEDSLSKDEATGNMSVCVNNSEKPKQQKHSLASSSVSTLGESKILHAICVADFITKTHFSFDAVNATATLLLITLITGFKHQIRVQLASRGFPIVGDTRYDGSPHTPMLLHACMLRFANGNRYTCLPDWDPPFQVPKNIVGSFLSQR